ncbi:type I pullulanase [Bacillus sp. FJAT-42376]|uniref:type I pullulanase n=1 Tax=Bacillus sp. FJAT-42376 TaxID=2014076 RepID=UPI000F4D5D44|nr:type I pullulanase [Bacillus sp. FJAT-42376]AZB43322.1 type I pullulanase [Bacillus sp. FJAT-42376]
MKGRAKGIISSLLAVLLVLSTLGGVPSAFAQSNLQTVALEGANADQTQQTYSFTLNYYRYDGKAKDWDLWIWEDGKDGKEVDFSQVTDGFAQVKVEAASNKINVIARPGNWTSQEMTRVIQIPEGEKAAEAYIVEGDPAVYYSREEANVGERMTSAMMDSMDRIMVTSSHPLNEQDINDFTLIDETTGKEMDAQSKKVKDNQVMLLIGDSRSIDVRNAYSVKSTRFGKKKVTVRKALDDKKFFYAGNDLGSSYTPSNTTFKVWAPTAQKVSLVLFDSAGTYTEQGTVEQHKDGNEQSMERAENGVWSASASGDLNGKFYMYKVEFSDGKVNYAVDPYAKAVSANGQRSAVVSLDETDPANWKPMDKPEVSSPADASLYELHVRDFSSDKDSGMKNKGKFKAFTETGTKNSKGDSTGIDHLANLGITYVHLLPSYDFKTVNELKVDDPSSKEPKFNWGYDPQNFNVPEGSYSTDPANPKTRILEFKEMVQALHNKGIRVVMDVVYNHTFEIENGPFNKIVPGYYYRSNDAGTYTNGSGTGNEVASERPMVRKYIKDSVKYWAEEYGVDGFRFDLMGLIDVNTMEQLTKELKEQVDPSMLVYGEPWQAGGSPLAESLQTTKGAQKDKGFAVFNDNIRGAIKGGSDDASKGFATGEKGKEEAIAAGVKGSITDFTNSPAESINYVTAHDNLNMWDKIIKTQGLEEKEGFVDIKDGKLQGEDANRYKTVEEAVAAATPYHAVNKEDELANETVKRSLLSNGIAITAQGIPFIHAGDEMLRTKYGDHNSYRSPDAINQIRWKNVSDFDQVNLYYQGLYQLRNSHPAFKMTGKQQVEANVEILQKQDNLVAYQLKNNANGDKWKNIVVIYNANTAAKKVQLPASPAGWKAVVNDKKAGTGILEEIKGTEAQVQPLSMMVLYDEERTEKPVPSVLTVSSENIYMTAGESRMLQASVKDQFGGYLKDQKITWTSGDEEVAAADSRGKLTAKKNGKTNVTVSSGSLKTTVTVTVADIKPASIVLQGKDSVYESSSIQLQSTVKDQFGQTVGDPAIEWTSSNPKIASVSSSGEITGLSAGKAVVTAKIGSVSAQKQIEVKKYVQRFVEFTYKRADSQYDGWNIWTWQTGVEDGEKRFSSVTSNGAVAKFPIGPDTTKIGFVLRKGTDWAVKDPYGQDRYIDADLSQSVTKVTVTSGVGEFDTVPPVKGPVLAGGKLTFLYRDQELYETSSQEQIERVQVKINGKLFPMTYDAKHQYFSYILDELKEGNYEYTFLVTKDGKTTEISDPYNTGEDGKSVVKYVVPKINVSASAYPKKISSRENAVITVAAEAGEDAKITGMSIDLRALGGAENTPIDPALSEISVPVKDSITAGMKTLPIIVKDQYGNTHKGKVQLEVKPIQVSGSGKDQFDWDEARIYFMLTDRFYDGDPSNNDPNKENYDKKHPETYHGGDLAGITKKLDYLEDMGINTIWISPIVDNVDWNIRSGKEGPQYAYHGYWAKDFTKLDEHLGDMKTFQKLIDKAHDKGIKIMVDVVLNHAGYGVKDGGQKNIRNYPTIEDSLRFKDMLRDGGTDVIKGELAGLPDFKTEDPAVRDQIIKWQTDWLKNAKTKRGDTIDYFRVDTVKHVDSTTWSAFKNELTKIKPDFKLIGENFGASADNTGGYLNSGQMDSLLDFGFKNEAAAFIQGKVDETEANLEKRDKLINNTASLGQFLSSHDEDGFLYAHAKGDLSKQKIAASLQITSKGQPVIYYGEELGLSGKVGGDFDKGEFNENRYDMAWDRIKGNDLTVHYAKLLQTRKHYSKVFSKGDRKKVAGSNEDGYIVFSRKYESQELWIGINTGNTAKTVTLTIKDSKFPHVKDLYSNKDYKKSKDGKVTVEIPPRSDGGTVILTNWK